MKHFLLFVIIIALRATTIAQTWTPINSLPGLPRYGAASTQTSTHGYVLGGETSTGRATDCWSYEPMGQTWNQIASYPGEPRSKAISFSYNDIVYYGWGDVNGFNDSLLYSYSPATNEWTEIPGAPAGISTWSASCFMIDSKAYMVTFNNLVISYDCSTGLWQQHGNFPGPQRSTGSAFAINGMGYFGLGYPFLPPFLNDFWKYNPQNDTWIEISGGFPGARRYASVGTASSNFGYILCGESQESPVFNNDVWRFDPTTETFEQLGDFPANRNYLSSFIFDGTVYAGCGAPGWNTSWWSANLDEMQQPCNTLAGTLQDGLVGYWPFCGNANDESGNGYDGVVNGATLTEDRFGNVGSAYGFDGVDNDIDITNLSINGDVSVSFWKRIENMNFSYPIGLGINPIFNLGFGIGIGFLSSGCGYQDSTLFVYDGADGCSNVMLSAPFLVEGVWYHTSFVRENGVSKLYENGSLIAESVNLDFPTFSNITFGRRSDNVSPFNGTLDDIGIWNRSLTTEEVQQLYGGELPVAGCATPDACNYNALATTDDGSCTFAGDACDDGNAATTNDLLGADCGCAGTIVNCTALEGTLQDGLVGYWPFCANANDESGNGNNGVVNGATLTEDRFGNPSNAFDFDGVNDYIEIIQNNFTLDTSFSISVWLKKLPNSVNRILSIERAGAPDGYQFRLGMEEGFWVPNDGQLYFHSAINGIGTLPWDNSIGYELTSNNAITNNTWQHAVVVKQGFNFLLYLNGQVQATVNLETNLSFGANPNSILLGAVFEAFTNTTTANFLGALDDIGIWNRALTTEEVQQLYGGELPVAGCTTPDACNYNALATTDDGSCTFAGDACDDGNAATTNDLLGADCGCAGTPVELGTPHTCGADFVHNPNLTYGTMTDQEGNVYKTIVIGEQEWMAENLNTSIYQNGDTITNVTNSADWAGGAIGAWAYYENNAQFECPYGKLYNWYAATDSRNVCPSGWHVPSKEEWSILSNVFGGNEVSGGKLKSTLTPYWYAPNEGATNESGFSALPGGIRYFDGQFLSNQGIGWWWTSTPVDETWAYQRTMRHFDSQNLEQSDDKRMGYSIRCVRDNNTGLIPGCTDPLAFNYNPQANVNEGCQYTATIFVYNDLNGNGEHEADEPGLSNWPVLGNDINGLVWTNSNGNVFLPLAAGQYEFTLLNPTDNWISTTPTSLIASLGSSCLDQGGNPAPCPIVLSTVSFGLQVIPGEAIVAVGPYQGFADIIHCTDGYESGVYLENIGSQTVSGFMTLSCDPLFTPGADSYFTTPPVETGPGYALWNIEDFMPGEFELLTFHIAGPGVEYLNQSFTFTFDITLLDPQGNMIYNDGWSVTPIVACAYDPNDLTGFPEGLSAPHQEGYTIEHYILPDNMVEFRVRFQNTGTLPAEDIDIYIPIDPNQWELSTIYPLMRSAEMQVICLHDDGLNYSIIEHELPPGVVAEDLLIFSFDDIYLPDSASNPEGSQGYVYFRMRAKHTLNVGDEINAQAFIYFEQNPPITTNETYHVIFDCMSFTPMTGDAQLCVGDDLLFSASQPYVDEFAWSINGLEGSNNIFIYEGIEAGDYTLRLNTSNVLCPLGEDHEVNITVHELPTLDLPLDATVCEGANITFDADSDGNTSWSNGANTGDTIEATESFSVTATSVGAGGCSVSEDWSVTVNALPSVAIDIAGNVLTAQDGTSWQWTVNGANAATTQSITAEVDGNYQVVITNEFGCTAESDVIEMDITSTLEFSLSSLSLYPNPMTSSARLELPQGTFDIALYDMTGSCVRVMQMQQGAVFIERGALVSGVYQVRITQGEQSKSLRLVVE